MVPSTTPFASQRLADACVAEFVAVPPHTRVMEAIAQMDSMRSLTGSGRAADRAAGCSSCVLVVEAGRLIGIVTQGDVMRLHVQQRPLTDLTVREVMTHPVITLPQSALTDIWVAIDHLQRHHIRHLPILDPHDRVIGIVTDESALAIARPPSLPSVLQPNRVDHPQANGSQDLNLATLISNLPGYIYRAHNDPNYTPEFISSGVEAITGYHPDEYLIERSISCGQEIHPDDASAVWDIVQAALQERRSYECEYRIITKSGQEKWVWERGQGIYAETGELQFLEGFVTDITVHKQAEFALMQSETQSRAILSAIPDLMLRIGADGVFREVVTLHRELDLVSSEIDPVGHSLAEFLPPDMLTRQLGYIQKALQTHELQVYEQQVWLGDRCQDEEVRVIKSADDEVLLMIRDISHRKQAERQLQTLVEGTAATIGQDFFPALVKHISEALQVAYALVSERVDQNTLRTLAFWGNGALQPRLTYHPAKTPCERTLQEGQYYCQSLVQQQFPEDRDLVTMGANSYLGIALRDSQGEAIGNLCILDPKPMVNPERIEDLLRVFAARASAELERQRATTLLEQLNAELEDRVARRTDELRQQEVQLQDFFDNANDLIQSVVLTDGRFDYVNRAWRETLGYTEAEVETLTIFDVLHPGCQAHCHGMIAQMQAGLISTLGQVELTFLTKTRQEIVVEGSINCRVENQHPVSTRAIFRDITARKAAEKLLQDREARYRALMDGANDAILLADPAGYLLEVNQKAEDLLGYTRAELTTMHVSQLHPPEELPRISAEFETLLQQGSAQIFDVNFRCKDGTTTPVDVSASTIEIQGKKILQGIFRDIRDRQRVELQLQQQASYKQLLWNLTQTIRQSLEIEVILRSTVTETRQLLGVDRVAIYRFCPDWSGEFIMESVVPGWVRLVGDDVHRVWEDTYLQETQGGRFLNYETLVVNDIYRADLQPCHIDLLEQFQARAYVIAPIFVGQSLWGLLALYQNGGPYTWEHREVELLQQITSQLAIAIYQANLYKQVQSELQIRQQAEAAISQQLQRQQALGQIVQHIRESLNLDAILATVTQQVKAVLNSDRTIVFRLFADGRSQIVEEAVSPGLSVLKDRHWADEVWSQDILDCYWQGQPRIVPDVMNDIWTDCLRDYSVEGQIQSKIVAPILQDIPGDEVHRWVSPSTHNKLWGVLVVHACTEKRVWQDTEAQLLQQIANQLAIAIQQANLFEQLQQELCDRQLAQQQLTERNQQLAISNAELARATRLKDEFLANMSHELRTPLNAILGMTEGLQEAVFGPINEHQIKALQTVERSGSHLLELINDILDLAKIEAGQIELDCAPIAVAPLFQSSLALIKQQALKKCIQLEVKLPSHLPDLIVDERRIRQVLINLLNNAVKFTPEGGRISLEAKLQEPAASHQPGLNSQIESHWMQFSVTDTGIGIAPEHIRKLFRPFVQIDSALNRQYQGTGLGLALVKRIVEFHGGQVSLTSTVGVGSCFTVSLPCLASPSSALALEPSSRGAVPHVTEPGVAPLILLVEDNEANVLTVSGYLSAKGYRLVLAASGQEAIAQAQAHHPDLILMDIQMPGMDGLEAIRQIRRDAALVDVPIIALTALAMKGDRERCLAVGANDYLSKPVKLKQLADTIQHLLGHC